MYSWRIGLMVLVLCLLAGGGGQGGLAQGNAEAALACQQDRWADFRRTDGTAFADQGDCVSYAAQGGTLVLKRAPSISVTVADAVHPTWGPGYTIAGTGSGFTSNTFVAVEVAFRGTTMTWHHGFTADSDGAGSFDYSSFFAPCSQHQAGFDITAYNERGDSVTTTVSTVPCN